jgi:two-component system KDP operon response regulator KdpE
MEELMARLRAALRKQPTQAAGHQYAIGGCLVDLGAHTVIRTRPPAGPGGPAGADDPAAADGAGGGGEAVHLTRTEWRMLEVLLRSEGQLVPASRLLTELWGPQAQDSTHYLRFHMARLRRKLEDDPPRPRHLLTEPGMGYRYQP